MGLGIWLRDSSLVNGVEGGVPVVSAWMEAKTGVPSVLWYGLGFVMSNWLMTSCVPVETHATQVRPFRSSLPVLLAKSLH
tara:strand:+ start:1323 stop:1562 length:240 start_codon:yes stop_codon:yes gene_type:complete